MNTADEFWAKAEPVTESGCWIWMGAVDPNGYGNVKWRGQYDKAHRVALSLDGADVSGAIVCHKCDTPSCVNPAHLYAGTARTNAEDMDRRGRRNPPAGERSYWYGKRNEQLCKAASLANAGAGNGCAKLTESQARAIKASGEPSRALAGRFGVSVATVNDIRSGRRWKHL